MESKNLLKKYYKKETHLHSFDMSMDARISPQMWLEFFVLNLPWVESLILCNHSHSPGVYDSKYISKSVYPNNYSNISPKLKAGIEVNILKDGSIDIDESSINRFEHVLGAINPLRIEYKDTKTVNWSHAEIESAILRSIEYNRFSVFASLVPVLEENVFESLSWDKILNLALNKNVAIEISLMANNPLWWLKKIANSNCLVAFGTDWHGMYHFRKFLPEGCSSKEKGIISKVIKFGGRNGFDILSSDEKKVYDHIYLTKTIPDDFYNWLAVELENSLTAGVDPSKIINR